MNFQPISALQPPTEYLHAPRRVMQHPNLVVQRLGLRTFLQRDWTLASDKARSRSLLYLTRRSILGWTVS